METLGDFIVVLSIMIAVSFAIVIGTIVSVSKSGDNLTLFEKKILIAVSIVLCLFVIILYVASNLEFFKALF